MPDTEKPTMWNGGTTFEENKQERIKYNKWRHIHYSDTPIAFHTITPDIPT